MKLRILRGACWLLVIAVAAIVQWAGDTPFGAWVTFWATATAAGVALERVAASVTGQG